MGHDMVPTFDLLPSSAPFLCISIRKSASTIFKRGFSHTDGMVVIKLLMHSKTVVYSIMNH